MALGIWVPQRARPILVKQDHVMEEKKDIHKVTHANELSKRLLCNGFTLYEGGTRVPLIISQPGNLPENRVSENVVSAFDLLPTMLSVAGEPVPDFADGIDLLPLLSGKEPKLQHETLHWKTADEWSVRRGDWKLHTVHGEGAAPVEKVELEQGVFLRNLRTDPSETINFAKQHPEILANLEQLHETWVATLPASMSNVPSATEWAEAPKEK